MMTWGRTDGAAMPPTPQANLALIDQLGMQLPSLMFSGELWLLTSKANAEARRQVGGDGHSGPRGRHFAETAAAVKHPPRPWSAG